jgi:hypothetical protein
MKEHDHWEEQDGLPVIEEELQIGKRQVSGGVVRVVSRVVSTPVSESIELRSEEAVVERRHVDRPASEADLAGFQERTIEVAETARKGEQVVVADMLIAKKQSAVAIPGVLDLGEFGIAQTRQIDAGNLGADRRCDGPDRQRHGMISSVRDEISRKCAPCDAVLLAPAPTKQRVTLASLRCCT